MATNRRIGLALGGGAARGIAHIGVLKVLHDAGITADCVAGTSVGSIIGAAYAAGVSWEEMWDLAQQLKWGEVVQPSLSGIGLVRSDKLQTLMERVLGSVTFDELKIPFAAVAVDIETAQEVVLSRGSVATAARASSSVPGIFEPVQVDGRLLVDGGVLNNVPSQVLRQMGAEVVIAVDLNTDISAPRRPANLIDITFRTFTVLMWSASRAGRDAADVLIEPRVSKVGYQELNKRNQLYDAGVEAAEAALPAIRRQIKRPWFTRLGR